jgi:hypothetical protein
MLVEVKLYKHIFVLKDDMIVDVLCKCSTKRELTHDVIQYCYNKLIPTDDINVIVHLRSQQLSGWCQHNHTNNFTVSINEQLSYNDLIKTICHEMVHVKQGIKNELEPYVNKYYRIWKGTKYNTLYQYQPWEVEAYFLEEKLFSSFTEQHSEK